MSTPMLISTALSLIRFFTRNAGDTVMGAPTLNYDPLRYRWRR